MMRRTIRPQLVSTKKHHKGCSKKQRSRSTSSTTSGRPPLAPRSASGGCAAETKAMSPERDTPTRNVVVTDSLACLQAWGLRGGALPHIQNEESDTPKRSKTEAAAGATGAIRTTHARGTDRVHDPRRDRGPLRERPTQRPKTLRRDRPRTQEQARGRSHRARSGKLVRPRHTTGGIARAPVT